MGCFDENGFESCLVSWCLAGDAVLLGSGQYFCPRCQKPVQLKGGQQTVPYFAHQTKVVGGGGESDAHQTGKVAIAALANALGVAGGF
ncbi:competence protein CoiA family protein [Latilactobacillus sakei]